MNRRDVIAVRSLAPFWLCIALSFTLSATGSARGEEASVEILLSGLKSPTSIAVRPRSDATSDDVYVAELGAGRLLHVAGDKPNAGHDVIVGFKTPAASDSGDAAGPRGLLFLNATRLVVTGSEPGNSPFVRIYEVADQGPALAADKFEQQVVFNAQGNQTEAQATRFNTFARTLSNESVADELILSGINRSGGERIWRLPIRGGSLGELKAWGKKLGPSASAAVAVEPRGHLVIVRSKGDDPQPSSQITFVNPKDTHIDAEFSVNLPEIKATAYSPKSGNMYALSRAASNASPSGVYRLDVGEAADPAKLSAHATMVAKVENPSAMAFGPEGVLYVTSLGTTGDGNAAGSVLKVIGDL